MPTRAVLFSFDGVLADTENIHVAAWQRTFRALGWAEPEESCLRAAGLADEDYVAEVFARRKIARGDIPGWVARKRDLTLQLLRDRPALRPGVAELVQALREAGIPLAVAAPAPRAHVEAVLAATGLLDGFDHLAAGDDPAGPGPVAAAVAALGVAPADAVALVGSPAAQAAASAAGLRAVLVAGPGTDGGGSTGASLPGLGDLAASLAALGA